MVSPQGPEQSRKFTEKKGLTMTLLVDSGNKVAKQYGLVYTVPEDLQKVYTQFGLKVDENNADGSWDLPISARYIIGTDRKIHYAALSADYTVRPDPSETVAALKEILKQGQQ